MIQSMRSQRVGHIWATNTHISSVWASLVAQIVKNRPAMQETWVWSRVRKIPWRREWQPTPEFLSGEFHGQRSLAGYIHGVSNSQTQLSTGLHNNHFGFDQSQKEKNYMLPNHIFYPGHLCRLLFSYRSQILPFSTSFLLWGTKLSHISFQIFLRVA